MKVNQAKTSMICMSGAQSYRARSYQECAGGDRVESGSTMKILGFHLSSRPTMHTQVAALSKKVRTKYWVLYHLRKAGFSEKELATVYRTCILPILDYCSVVYHSLLTDEQDQAIERLQSSALRCIYGYEMSYMKMRELAKVKTLRQRRIDACDKFCLLYTSPSPRD